MTYVTKIVFGINSGAQIERCVIILPFFCEGLYFDRRWVSVVAFLQMVLLIAS